MIRRNQNKSEKYTKGKIGSLQSANWCIPREAVVLTFADGSVWVNARL